MMLRDGMLLYHGSYARVEKIDLSLASPHKDFGKGFYLTSNQNQARNFLPSALIKAKSRGLIPESHSSGFVSTFRFHLNEAVKTYEFDTPSKEWLWFISQNRRKNLAQALIPLISDSVFQAEIIVGKVANDTTNPVITTYLNGLFGDVTSDRAINFAIEELMTEHLDNQFCFLTEEAVSCLEFLEVREYVIR